MTTPVVIDTAKDHCPEASQQAKDQATNWVKTLKPEQNTIGDAKKKLAEYQLGQVRDKSALNEALKDNDTCRNGGSTMKVAHQ